MAASAAIAPADATHQDPTTLSLEQLGQVQVSGVSRAQERMLDAPASVTVLTRDDIRIAGYRTLGDVLNGARGMFSYTDRTYNYVGVRGFAPVGDYNTRVLLLIDGYRANDNVYDQAAIGTDALVDLDLVERVELIRGPSSSVYGANAFFGVINVITRSASSMGNGGSLLAGSERTRGGSATLAGRVGEEGHFYLRATRERGDGGTIEFPRAANALPNRARFDDATAETVSRIFARGVMGRWRVTFGHVERDKRSGYGLYGSDFADPSAHSGDRHTYVDGRFEQVLGDRTDWMARAFAGQYTYDDRFTYAADRNIGVTQGRWFGAETVVTHRFTTAHRLVAGVEAQRDARHDQSVWSESFGTLLDDRRDSSRLGFFVQDDVQWSPRWSSSIGVRRDHYRGDERTSPRGAVIYHPTPDSALKLIAGSAFRAPNSYERYYAASGFVANPDLRAESIRTVDLVYEAALGAATRVALGAFRFRANDLVTQMQDGNGDLGFFNLATARSRGFEAEIEHSFSSWFRARGVLSTQRTVDGSGARLENSPAHVARVSGIWRLTPAGWHGSAEAVRIGSRRTTTDVVPAHSLLNLALTSPVPRTGASFALSVHNALDRDAVDPVPPGALPAGLDRIPLAGRTWLARIGYAF